MSAEDRRWAWQRLRLLRASPPGLAEKSGARAELVSASLEQCEQLMTAALGAGPAARPLPLFYALSQATRAICAVHLKHDFVLRRHGLTWPEAVGTASLMHRQILPAPAPVSAFTRLCSVLRCSDLSGPVALGNVWRALPDLAKPDLPQREPGWLNALVVGRLAVQRRISRGPEWVEIYAGPRDVAELGVAEWTQRLKRYPSLDGWAPTPSSNDPEEPTYLTLGSPPTQVLVLRCAIADTSTGTEAATRVRQAGPLYGGSQTQYAIPTLAGGEFLAPLALWWVVLFALSNLARYEPDQWLRVLNVDRSPLAVPLEDCLVEAIDVLPHHILEALVGRRVIAHSYPETEG